MKVRITKTHGVVITKQIDRGTTTTTLANMARVKLLSYGMAQNDLPIGKQWLKLPVIILKGSILQIGNRGIFFCYDGSISLCLHRNFNIRWFYPHS